jgi:AcrR family transcriptional regulator
MSTRQLLIECALKEIERSGVNRFSLRAVGVAAGLSAMAVYRHFRNREDLLRAVGEEAFGSFQQRIAAVRDGPLTAWIVRVTDEYAAFAFDDAERFDACFVLKTGIERSYPRDFRAGKSPVIWQTVLRIRAAQAKGQARAGDAVEHALLMWAQVHGLVMLHRAGRFALKRAAFLALCRRAVRRYVQQLLLAEPSKPGSPGRH